MENTTNTEAAKDGTLQNFFTGSIPKNYDTYMGPILFTPYGIDLAGRMNMTKPVKVLELACGTGRVTKHLLQHLPQGSHLFATDISQDMIDVAKETIAAENLTWQIVDMASIPFKDEEFNIIVCQFGLMFVPDKVRALTEMHRVLKTGGQLIFNTWGNIEENLMWQISFKNFTTFFGEMPMPKELGPFGLTNKTQVLELLQQAGFTNTTATQVRKTSQVETAALAAKGFLLTSPVLAKKPELFPQIQVALEKELAEKLGDNPLHANLLALVFEATK